MKSAMPSSVSSGYGAVLRTGIACIHYDYIVIIDGDGSYSAVDILRLWKNICMDKIIITTSWDDGPADNLRLTELLNKYNLKATFYLAKNHIGKAENEIKEIAKTQEIGAHTLTHPSLTEISLSKAEEEIKGSKDYLENLLSREVKMFSYPRGLYNEEIKELVKRAGFIGARTVKTFNSQPPKDFFSWDPTIHLYPHPFRKRDAKTFHLSRHLLDPFWQNFSGLVKWNLSPSAYLNWPVLAKATFDYVYKNGGVWHLWGHCIEIEKYNMWSDLENIFIYIKGFDNVKFLTNGDYLQQL